MVTKGYQKGVYERVTSGIRGGKGVAGAKARGVFRGYAALKRRSSTVAQEAILVRESVRARGILRSRECFCYA